MIIDRIMTEYNCPFCHKVYMRKYPFYNHKLICELAYKKKESNNNNNNNNVFSAIISSDKVPSNTELFEFILTLYDKYETLQKDYTVLKSFINNTKQKLNIIDWLNTNCVSGNDYSFHNIFMKAKINKEHLIMVFEHDYINGLFAIIMDLIENNPNANNTIKSFVQKESTLYIHGYNYDLNASECVDNNNNTNTNTKLLWTKMTTD